MRRLIHSSAGVLGQILAILLLTLIVEFGASTLLYERAGRFSVRDDEAHRLAEHLVISRDLLADRVPAARAAMAAELSTERYAIRWQPVLDRPPRIAPELDAMRRQVIDWEPRLAAADLRLHILSPGRDAVITGALRLPDRSWLQFRTLEPVTGLNLAIERVAIALVPALALMVIGGLLVRRTLLPLRRLAAAADRMGSRDEVPIAVDGAGEVRRVMTAFARMQGRIGRLIADRTQALAAVGHDLRTPLARLRLRADGVGDDDTREAMARDIGEMEAMIASLLAFLGGGEAESVRTVDVAVMAATIADDAADHGGDVRYEGPDHLEWRLRPLAIKRALVNLVDNALHHGDAVVVTAGATPDGLTLTVEDDGPGIPDEALARVLEPFVRLDGARRRDTVGFGLGLSIVAQAVEAEGGRLTLANRDAGGLCATIAIPRRT